MSEALQYEQQVMAWREQMEASLRAEDGWLTLAGLFWLKEGQNRFGSDPSNEIVLPAGSAAPFCGSLELLGGQTKLQVTEGVAVTVNGGSPTANPLRGDNAGSPDLIAIGSLQMHILQRGTRIGIRLRDTASPGRHSFGGRRWFPVDEAYKLTASFTAYNPPRSLPIPNILGDIEEQPNPGYVQFLLHDQICRLEATEGRDGGLFIIFRDGTSGTGSYPSGRFLYTKRPQDGKVVVDFNLAYSPPCAFTPYATCPLPPPQNQLTQRIAAGEQYDHDEH